MQLDGKRGKKGRKNPCVGREVEDGKGGFEKKLNKR